MSHTTKQLSYSSLVELEKMCQSIDFKTLDFNKPAICNSLLKMLDKAGKYLEDEGDDERAYIMYMRFFEGYMQLRKSRFYKEDKQFVESMISSAKLNESMSRLEQLKDELKVRYDQKMMTSRKGDADVPPSPPPKEDATNENEQKVVLIEKKVLNPKELVNVLVKAIYRILIIDARPKSEFDRSHMMLDLVLTMDKQRQLVSYINLPPECIQNVSWQIEGALKKNNLDEQTATVFAQRREFDYVVVFDRDSNTSSLDSKLVVLKRALYDFDQEPCKNEPLVLDGGWKQWIVFYPGLVSSLLSNTTNDDKSPPPARKIDKLFDFDYPEIVDSKVAAAVAAAAAAAAAANRNVVLKPLSPQSQMINNNNNEIRLEPIENETQAAVKEAAHTSNVPKSESTVEAVVRPVAVERPIIDRSNKPEHKPVESSAVPPSASTSASTSVAPNPQKTSEVASNAVGASATTAANNIPQSKPNVNTPAAAASGPIKKPMSQNRSDVDVDEKRPSQSSDSFDSVIYNTVYAPHTSHASRHAGRPIQTPYMQEGSTKVLNKETGLFLYNPPPSSSQLSQPSSSSSSSLSSSNTVGSAIVKATQPTPSTATMLPPPPPPPTRPSVKKPQPVAAQPAQQPSSKSSSNLKRTFSSPNIAKLGDELEQLDMGEVSHEKEAIIQRDFGKTDVSNKVIKNKPAAVTVPAVEPVKQPKVNRNSKPMPEHVMRTRFEELQPVYGNVPRGLTGIRNLGNTCFMNSIIQCLASTELLVKYFLADKHRYDLNRSNELGFGGNIADEFSVIVNAMWNGHCRSIAPVRFKRILGQFNEQFVSNEQQDAQELLLFLLDGLHEDLNRVVVRPKITNNNDEADENEKNLNDQQLASQAWTTHLSMNNSIIVDLFQGQFKSTVRCLSCDKKSIKFDAFMYLTLPLSSQKCDIYQCLETFLQNEKISGESKWKCPKCKVHREAVKKIDIWRMPPILIIHLKRFKYQGLFRDKIKTLVDYPVEHYLNMDKYMLSGNNRTGTVNNNNNYRLYAVSFHNGTMDGGHYTAACKHIEMDRWFKFDDTEVNQVKHMDDLRSNLSYILFYTRI